MSIFQRLFESRPHGNWQKPRTFDRNLIVIGAGAAGLVSAYIAATVKARVSLVESGQMGGDCLNYGCVPSKALIKSASIAYQMRHADRYGLSPVAPQFSFRTIMQRIETIIARIEPHDSPERYRALGVDVIRGHARIIDPWRVEITGPEQAPRTLTTRSIIIAAGARPFVPDLPGLEDGGYVTSNTLWHDFARLDQPPPRLVVLGGGPIGCELAQSFARLGSHVTLVEVLPRVLIREDPEVADMARQALLDSGVELLTSHRPLRCERRGEHRQIIVENASEETIIEFDALLCATGRSPRLTGYGLEELGIKTEHTIVTDNYLRTLHPNIFAAGDVAGPYQFTHVAAHQAWYATVNALFGNLKLFRVDYSVIPWTTFIDPEIARVGMNEQDAAAQDIPYEVTRYELSELDRAITDSSTQGFVKVLTVPGRDRILGATIVGSHACDLLPEFVLAMKHGIGLNKILATIHTYPTLSEASKYAAGQWKRAHAPRRLLALAQRYHAWRRQR
ncbi:MAG: FAD-dependent oxidoreductase [Pseudomonadales bacterium]|nr:FAD-dependent oxidoreductase [Pseudomonadales bacterium]